MLYVYATRLRKAPLNQEDWKSIDDQLIEGLLMDPGTINISKSGYDSIFRWVTLHAETWRVPSGAKILS